LLIGNMSAQHVARIAKPQLYDILNKPVDLSLYGRVPGIP